MRTEKEIYSDLVSPGDPETKEALQAEFLQALRAHSKAIIWKMLHEHREDLENLIAERTLKGLNKFRGDPKFISTWTRRIITNAINDALRVTISWRNRQVSIPVEDVPLNTESAIHAKLTLDSIRDKLQGEERELLILKMQGASYHDIQRSLGLSSELAARLRWMRLQEKIKGVICA